MLKLLALWTLLLGLAGVQYEAAHQRVAPAQPGGAVHSMEGGVGIPPN
jgi:hypothetical protein